MVLQGFWLIAVTEGNGPLHTTAATSMTVVRRISLDKGWKNKAFTRVMRVDIERDEIICEGPKQKAHVLSSLSFQVPLDDGKFVSTTAVLPHVKKRVQWHSLSLCF